MLYATTYYDNVKPRRRVRHLPTAGRGGGHPQAASSAWRAILVDGDGRMVGETRPRGPVGSICPDTENAPPCGGAERLRNHRIPEKLPRTANRLLRSPRRQTKLSSRNAAKRPGRPYCNGPPGPISSLRGKHTFANAPGFRDRGASPAALAQLPMDFGRIVLSVKPYSPGLPLSFRPHGATPMPFRREVPTLVAATAQYSATVSAKAASLPAFLGFQVGDVP